MSTLITLNNFEEIYNKTYNDILKYIICKCRNFDDVNELMQDTYIELYQALSNKKSIKVSDENAYIRGIAKNIINKYYRDKYEEKANILYISKENENKIHIPSYYDFDENIINKENIVKIWDYLNNKNILIAKIFYLYYALGLKITEISKELKISESTVKNYIYRTLKELIVIMRKNNSSKLGKEITFNMDTKIPISLIENYTPFLYKVNVKEINDIVFNLNKFNLNEKVEKELFEVYSMINKDNNVDKELIEISNKFNLYNFLKESSLTVIHTEEDKKTKKLTQ